MAVRPATWSTHVARIDVRSWSEPGTHISGTTCEVPTMPASVRAMAKPSSVRMCRSRRGSLSTSTSSTSWVLLCGTRPNGDSTVSFRAA